MKLGNAIALSLLAAACNQQVQMSPAVEAPSSPPTNTVTVSHSNLLVRDSNGNTIAYYLDGVGSTGRFLLPNGKVARINMWTGLPKIMGVFLYTGQNCTGVKVLVGGEVSGLDAYGLAPNEVVAVGNSENTYVVTGISAHSEFYSTDSGNGSTCTTLENPHSNIAYTYEEATLPTFPTPITLVVQ